MQLLTLVPNHLSTLTLNYRKTKKHHSPREWKGTILTKEKTTSPQRWYGRTPRQKRRKKEHQRWCGEKKKKFYEQKN